jgi:hypothetical protein
MSFERFSMAHQFESLEKSGRVRFYTEVIDRLLLPVMSHSPDDGLNNER